MTIRAIAIPLRMCPVVAPPVASQGVRCTRRTEHGEVRGAQMHRLKAEESRLRTMLDIFDWIKRFIYRLELGFDMRNFASKA